MKQRKWPVYWTFLLVTQGVGALSGWLSRDGMQHMESMAQSALTPPGIVFPIVWGILYTLMAVGGARVWLSPEGEDRERGLWFYVFQLIFNFFWSLIYFNMNWFGVSLLWLMVLWVLILGMTLSFYRVDPLSGWLQVPYLIWVAFAGYLNFVVWRLNG